jgi:hypothetical protein
MRFTRNSRVPNPRRSVFACAADSSVASITTTTSNWYLAGALIGAALAALQTLHDIRSSNARPIAFASQITSPLSGS